VKDRLGRWLMNWRRQAVLPHVRGRLLDLGCGMNALVLSYQGQGVGVDVYQWGAVDVIIEDAARLPFADGTFDTVTIVAALNHIPNRAEALADVHRVLKDGGRVIVTMLAPLVSRLWHGLRRPWDADQTARGMVEGEVYGLSRRRMRRLLADARFEIVREQRFMLGLNRLTIARKP
jgi:SAM-dependent methyltransferase